MSCRVTRHHGSELQLRSAMEQSPAFLPSAKDAADGPLVVVTRFWLKTTRVVQQAVGMGIDGFCPLSLFRGLSRLLSRLRFGVM